MALTIHVNHCELTLFFLTSCLLVQSLFSSLHNGNSDHQEWRQWLSDSGEAQVTGRGDVGQERSPALDAG